MTPRDIVGLAHVIVGAYGLFVGTFGTLFAFSVPTPAMLVLSVGLVATGLLTVLAGLWLRDGRPRGAVLAAVLDSLRLALLVWAQRDISVDVILTAGLLGAVVWLWPTLGDEDS